MLQVSGTIQDAIAKEIKEIASKKYSVNEIDYADIWRFRSTLVRGIRSNLQHFLLERLVLRWTKYTILGKVVIYEIAIHDLWVNQNLKEQRKYPTIKKHFEFT